MHRIGRTMIAGTALAVAACADSTGPPVDQQRQDLGTIAGEGVSHVDLHPLSHQMQLVDPDGTLLLSQVPGESPAGTESAAYQMTFRVYYGLPKTIEVSHFDDETGEGSNFLRFHVPARGLFTKPDGDRYRFGESVLITLAIDPSRFILEFEPSGLVFNPDDPAELEIWYGGADGDVPQDQLGIWFQQDTGMLWYPLVSAHDTLEMWFKTHLFHFSGYAVSW